MNNPDRPAMPFSLKLFGSFVLLAGIPILGLSLLNRAAAGSFYRKELGKSYLERLKVADTFLVRLDEELRRQALNISLNERLNRLDSGRIDPEKFGGYEYLNNLLLLTADLENLARVNSLYYAISIELEGSDYRVTSHRGVVPVEKNSPSPADFPGAEPGRVLWLEGEGDQPPGERLFTCLVPLNPYVTRFRGAVVFNIRERELSKLVNGGAGDQGADIFIINREGLVLSGVNGADTGAPLGETPAIRKVLAEGGDAGFFTARINGEPVFVIHRRSSLNRWHFCSFVSMDRLNAQVGAVYFVTVMLMIVFLALAVFFSYLFSRRLDRPVTSMAKRLRENEELISEYHLKELLTGEPGPELPPEPGLFPLPFFCCLALNPGPGPEPERERILEPVLSGLAPLARCRGLEQKKGLWVIVLNFETLDQGLLLGTLKKIRDETAAAGKGGFSAGVGRVGGLEDLRLSYNTALRALSRKLLEGPLWVGGFEDEAEASRRYYYPYDQEKMIFNNLRLRNRDGTIRALEDFFEHIRDRGNISVDNAVQAFNQLLGAAIKYLVDLHINSREIFEGELSLYQTLAEFEFIDGVKGFFTGILEKIIAYECRENLEKKSPINKILDYLEKNRNSRFDLNALSDAVGLSYSHVRRLFTEATGENILSYVYKQKIQAAKKLLLETDLPAAAISENLGFYNLQSFFRFFKKYEGLTPGEYRESANPS